MPRYSKSKGTKSGNRQIKLPSKTKTATVVRGGNKPGYMYGAGYKPKKNLGDKGGNSKMGY